MPKPPLLYSLLLALALPALRLSMAEDAGGGGNTDPPPSTPPSGLTQADLDKAIQAALAAQAAEFNANLKKHTGHDSFQALGDAEAKKRGDFEALVGQKDAELSELKGQLAKTHIKNVLGVAAHGSLDPETVVALLEPKAVWKDGLVSVDGKTASDAVKALLEAKPHLAKPGPAGSGSPRDGGGDGGVTNPWAKDSFNLTVQGKIERENPQLAERLKAQAKASK